MRFLDENFNPLYEIDVYESLVWHELYNGCGDFEAHVFASYQGVKYVYNTDLKQLGVIENMRVKGSKVVYTGRMLKSILANRVINKVMNYENKTTEFIVKDLVGTFAEDYNIAIDVDQGLGRKVAFAQVHGENLMDFIDKLLEMDELGCRIDYDYKTKQKKFVVYKGKDNSKDKLPLSLNFETIYDFDFNIKSQKYRNYAYVFNKPSDNVVAYTEIVDKRREGEDKLEIFVDANDVQREFEGSKLTEQQIRNAMKQKGEEALIKYLSQYQLAIRYNESANIELGETRLFSDNVVSTTQRVVEITTGYEGGIKEQTCTLGSPSIIERRNLL